MNNCCLDGLPTPAVAGPAVDPFDPCQDAQRVIVCAPPVVPVDAQATTCDADTTVKAANLLSQAVHTTPGTALMVRLCPTAQDREMQILCAPDGTKVAVQNVTPLDAAIGTAPVFESWNLDGSLYAGAIADLKDCGAEKVDITEGEDYCLNGVNYTRVDIIDTTTLLPVGTLWLDDLGVPVAAPSGAIKGVCPLVAKQLIYLERNGGVVTMGDIIASSAAVSVHSVTVKQINGQGTVKADSGSGVPLDAGEVWSWSVVSQTNTDTLAASSLTLDAGGGEQRITAIYTI